MTQIDSRYFRVELKQIRVQAFDFIQGQQEFSQLSQSPQVFLIDLLQFRREHPQSLQIREEFARVDGNEVTNLIVDRQSHDTCVKCNIADTKASHIDQFRFGRCHVEILRLANITMPIALVEVMNFTFER